MTRNDYVGFSIVRESVNLRSKLLSFLIKKEMNIEEKTMIRIYVNNLTYNQLKKELEICCGPAS